MTLDYRDDWLAIFKNTSGPKKEKKKENFPKDIQKQKVRYRDPL